MVLIASASACTSFKAVETTGALATDLSAHTEALAFVETLCHGVGSATANDDVAPEDLAGLGLGCASLLRDANAWTNVIGAVVGYGKALEELAGAKAVDVSAELEGVRAGLEALGSEPLSTERAKAAVGAAGALVELVTRELRRKQLARAIVEAEPQVQTLVQHATDHVRYQLRVIDGVQAALLNSAQDLITKGAADDVLICKLADGTEVDCKADDLRLTTAGTAFTLNGWLLERRLALVRLRAALQSFASAHHVLAEDASSIGREDAAHLVEILAAVEDVYAELHQAQRADDDPQ